jgi:hypothetical protein
MALDMDEIVKITEDEGRLFNVLEMCLSGYTSFDTGVV